MQQIAFSFFGDTEPLQTPPRRAQPALWIARLAILREPRLAEDAVIRDLELRRGLNVLWAPPSAERQRGDNRLFEGRLTGHTAGKTTFCRLIRYLLGEERFGTARGQDRIRARIPEGWVVGEIMVRGERWCVGRPFARGVHPFAATGVSLADALQTRAGYQDFQAALAAATVADLPVQTLPHARRPIDWPLLLTWVARDQEARFAGVVDFRHPSSESASPSPKVADRHVVLRAVLDLMSDEEGQIQQAHEALGERRKQLEEEAHLLRRRADEDRARLSRLLGLRPDDSEAGPLFAGVLRDRIDARRAALEQAERALVDQQAAADLALGRATLATRDHGARQQRLEDAEEALRQARERAAHLEPPPATPPANSPALPPPAPGRCSVSLAIAAARGCPLAAAAAEPAPGHAQEAREADIAELEQKATAARQAAAEAEAAHGEIHARYLQQSAALLEERGRLGRERAALEEIGRLQGFSMASQAALQRNAAALAQLGQDLRELSGRRASRQRAHARALGRLSEIFENVIQALLGRSATGRVDVGGGELELHITEHGEREGAAMETLKVLAFDLAALALAMEGHGRFPGLLLHDGPREADMDERIYERLFLYAAEELERRTPGDPEFQYLITTTAPPPESLRQHPWVLEPQLDASVPEGRLLRMDL